MPITPFLRNQAFQPEMLGELSKAFELVCAMRGVSSAAEPAAAEIARHIIVLAQRGIRDSNELARLVMGELYTAPPV
jgi:hypothetical protein